MPYYRLGTHQENVFGILPPTVNSSMAIVFKVLRLISGRSGSLHRTEIYLSLHDLGANSSLLVEIYLELSLARFVRPQVFGLSILKKKNPITKMDGSCHDSDPALKRLLPRTMRFHHLSEWWIFPCQKWFHNHAKPWRLSGPEDGTQGVSSLLNNILSIPEKRMCLRSRVNPFNQSLTSHFLYHHVSCLSFLLYIHTHTLHFSFL